jgi:hypothetical protein
MPQTKEKYQHYLTKSSANQSRKYSRAVNNLIKHLNINLANSDLNESSRENKETSSNIIGNFTRRFSNNLILSVQNLYESKNYKSSNLNNNNNNNSKINTLKADSELIENNFNINDVIFNIKILILYFKIQINEKIYLKVSFQDDDKIDIFKNQESINLKLSKKIYEFYNAPITKFYLNLFVYNIFIFFYMYMLLTQMTDRISWPELFVLLYISSYGFDKIREVSLIKQNT